MQWGAPDSLSRNRLGYFNTFLECELFYGLSIRIKTNRGFFPRCKISEILYNHLSLTRASAQTEALFFLLYRALLLCQLPLVLSANGTHHLHGRSRRMDLYPFRSSNMVSLPVPASGNLYFRFSDEANCITYSLLGNKKIVKFKITDWAKDNTILEYNCPCKKDDGFSFSLLQKSMNYQPGKCSEMDMLLDMWIHAIQWSNRTRLAFSAPVVYYRNNTGNPDQLQSLGERWGHSKTTISRILKKFEELNFITLVSFKGKHGSFDLS